MKPPAPVTRTRCIASPVWRIFLRVTDVLSWRDQPGSPGHSPRLAITAVAVVIKILRSSAGQRDWA